MVYPAMRSMNADLEDGMSDGKYKKIVINRGGVTEKELMYAGRMDLSDTYFGIHEIADKVLPDGTVDHDSAEYTPNLPTADATYSPN